MKREDEKQEGIVGDEDGEKNLSGFSFSINLFCLR